MCLVAGTPDYVAPEVLKGEGYGLAVDNWAIGVLTYILLCGYPPFYDKQQALLFQKIMAVQYKFHENEWKDISVQAKDFIKRLLVEQPMQRNSAKQALHHKWLQMNQNDNPNPKMLRSLPTTQRLPAYKEARARGQMAAGAANDLTRSAESSDSSPDSPDGAARPKRGELRSTKAAKGLQAQLMASKAVQSGQSKRDKSYQIVLLGSKHAPVELADGFELVYKTEWLERLIEFIKLEQKYHARANANNWIFEIAFLPDALSFRVRGAKEVKDYVKSVLVTIGKL